MPRFVTTVVFACAFAALGAPVARAADSCPNAAYRHGPGANLPDCRAWEQATPVDKGGSQPDPQLGAYPAPGGDRVITQSPGDIGGAQGVSYLSTFASTRGLAWNTIGTDAVLDSRPTNFFDLIAYPTVGFSDDRSKALVVSLQKLAPQATKGDSNLYVRDTATGAYTWAATAPGSTLYTNLLGIEQPPSFFAANPNFTAIAFTTFTALEPGAVDDGNNANLYLVKDGRITLENRDDSGTAVPANREVNGGSGPKLVSDDGRRVTFAAQTHLYQRVDGQSTVLVARSHRAADDPNAPVGVASGDFSAWPSADGTSMIFNTSNVDPLTEDNTPSAFYRWSADGDRLDNLLEGVAQPWGSSAGSFALLRVSSDQRYLWFTYTDVNANGDYTGQLAVLDTRDKQASIEASSVVSVGAPLLTYRDVRSSPDGTKLVALSRIPLTSYDQTTSGCAGGPCAEAYAFDATQPDAAPVCLSCGPAGSHSVGDAGVGVTLDGRPFSTPAANDGRVFFDTPQRLTAADVNDQSDVYQYTPGKPLQLISSGTGSTPAAVSGISASTNDVFFFSADRLVPQDSDGANDVYDARVNGGLAAQQVPYTNGSSCASGTCRGPQTPVPPPDASGTSILRGVPSPPVFRVGRVSSAARRAAASTGRLRVSVRVGASGRLAARASARLGRRTSTIGRAAATSRKAGRLTLTLKLSAAARRAVARGGKLAVGLSVSYSRAAKPASQSFTLTAPRARSTKKGGAR